MKTVLIAVLALIMLGGCAAGPNVSKGTADESGEPAGFLKGLWHGLIMPIAFVISLFSEELGVYEVHNNGGWYNLGYLLGLSATLGGGGKGTCSRRRRR